MRQARRTENPTIFWDDDPRADPEPDSISLDTPPLRAAE
jgi:hypothetical protein